MITSYKQQRKNASMRLCLKLTGRLVWISFLDVVTTGTRL